MANCKLTNCRKKGEGTFANVSDVFMMDTWWNEAIEQQAIDRVHRLGQNKPVYVTRYVIKGTVEKRILKIRECFLPSPS